MSHESSTQAFTVGLRSIIRRASVERVNGIIVLAQSGRVSHELLAVDFEKEGQSAFQYEVDISMMR
jgi:hypothetical protein